MAFDRGGVRAWGAAALLVPSGAAALAQEAAWARLWTPWAGAGVSTAGAVAGGTLLGLGLGAWLGGRLVDRTRAPGAVWAGVEVLGGVLALAVVGALRALEAAPVAGTPWDAWAARLGAAFLGSLLPALPLGASLPAALAALAPAEGRAGPVLRLLYAANTAGAVLGVWAATGLLIEVLGLSATVGVAAAVQGLCAVAVAVAFGRRRTSPAARTPGPPAPGPGAHAGSGPRGLAAAAFLAGAAGLVVQVAWVRRLAPALGTTAYAFGTVLGAYLAAIAVGTALFGPRRARPAGTRPALVLLLAAFPAAAMAPLVEPVSRAAAEALAAALAAGEATAARLLGIRAAAATAVLLPAAALGAAALPWLLHAASPATASCGRASGRLLGWNTVGSAAGAVATGPWLVPALGTAGALRAAGALYLLAAACASRGRRRTAALGLAAVLAALAAAPLPDEAGRDAVGATFDPLETDPTAATPRLFAEGRVSTVVVRDRDGRPELWVDGKIVASAAPTDRLHLALLGHLPMLAHARPRRVAVVGLGTGITATACAAHGPEVLDVFELEGEVARAAEAFRPFGGGLPAGARLAVADGRHALLRSDSRYDVVTTDPVHPAAAGSAGLYTREHFRLVASRLADGGVACQWLPLYEVSGDDIRAVLRTFGESFRPAVFVAGPDLVILGTKRPLALDERAINARMEGAVGAGLRSLGLADAGRLLGLLLADPERALRLAGPGPVTTDDRPFLEFASARSQYTSSSLANLRWLSFAPSPPEGLLARTPSDPEAFAAGVARSRRMRAALGHWLEGGVDAWGRAHGALEDLAAEDPTDAFAAAMRDEVAGLLARAFARTGDAEAAEAYARAVLASPAADDRQRLDAAEALASCGRVAEASEVARAVLRRRPDAQRARRLAAGAR